MDEVRQIITTKRSDLIAIADAVREKTGKTEEMTLGDMVRNIRAISATSDTDTSDATATTADILNGKTAYSANGKITGTIPSQEAKTITPTKATQTAINAGVYAVGAVTVEAIPSDYIITTDATAVASDIATGKTAYVNGTKITGTHIGSTSGTDTSDATATAADIVSGQTAYVNGTKVTGTLVVQSYYLGDAEPSASLGVDGDLFLIRGE